MFPNFADISESENYHRHSQDLLCKDSSVGENSKLANLLEKIVNLRINIGQKSRTFTCGNWEEEK